MNSNINLGPRSSIRGCLIVRLDGSDSLVTFSQNAKVMLEDSIFYAEVPSLWSWIKLWWQVLRKCRKGQPPAKYYTYVTRPAALKGSR